MFFGGRDPGIDNEEAVSLFREMVIGLLDRMFLPRANEYFICWK